MQIKLINEIGKYLGLLSYKAANIIAKKKNLDLIKISEINGCYTYKLGNYNKYIYTINKKKKKGKYKTKVKEISFDILIEKNDLYNKLYNIIRFLKKKYNVKIIIINKHNKGCSYTYFDILIKKIINIINEKIIIKEKVIKGKFTYVLYISIDERKIKNS